MVNDYEADIEFGKWMRERRMSAGLSIEQAAIKALMSETRIKSLETGLAVKGIQRKEVEMLSSLYGVAVKEFMAKAEAA
jgi:hypothetical protein